MFGNSVSRVSFLPNEIYYISPVYKKNKIKSINKVRNIKRNIKGLKLSKANKQNIQDIFKDIDLNSDSCFIYDEKSIKYLTEYIFMGTYYDEWV